MAAPATPQSKSIKLLRRYTDLTAAIDLLTHRRLVLLDPALWDDRNDSFFIRRYREIAEMKSVLALCLSETGETYHHWRVFCGHPSGVCIEFYRKDLLTAADAAEGVSCGKVKYKTLEQMEQDILALNSLPFIKRWAFRHEAEYRLIYRSANEARTAHAIDAPLSMIHGITLSPWLPAPLLEATRKLLNGIPGCENIPISRSELIENERWKRNAERLVSKTANMVAEAPAGK